MGQTSIVLLVSDIHYAGSGELARRNPEGAVVVRPWLRPVASAFRALWLGNLSRNNILFNAFIDCAESANLVIANGDFSCDSAFVGLSDDPAYASARECLTQLRLRFGERFEATIGDHELGRRSLFGGSGGLRLASWRRSVGELKLKPFWQVSMGRYEMMGVASSLLDLEAFETQLVPEERNAWHRLREEHLHHIRQAFEQLSADRRVLLFCHDPAALPWLGQEEAVRSRFGQIEKTVTGHLHSRFVISGIRLLAYVRNSVWRDFRVLVCPALACRRWPLAGLYYRVSLDLEGQRPLRFRLQGIRSGDMLHRPA